MGHVNAIAAHVKAVPSARIQLNLTNERFDRLLPMASNSWRLKIREAAKIIGNSIYLSHDESRLASVTNLWEELGIRATKEQQKTLLVYLAQAKQSGCPYSPYLDKESPSRSALMRAVSEYASRVSHRITLNSYLLLYGKGPERIQKGIVGRYQYHILAGTQLFGQEGWEVSSLAVETKQGENDATKILLRQSFSHASCGTYLTVIFTEDSVGLEDRFGNAVFHSRQKAETLKIDESEFGRDGPFVFSYLGEEHTLSVYAKQGLFGADPQIVDGLCIMKNGSTFEIRPYEEERVLRIADDANAIIIEAFSAISSVINGKDG